jgi:LPXTG-motif cell wall-anchored protein
MSTGAFREVTVPDSRTAVVDGKQITVHDLKPGTTLTATYTTTATPVTDRTVQNLSGKVWFVSGNTVILTLPDGTNKMYKAQPHFTFKIDGNDKADVSNLRKGMNVSAEKIIEEPSVIVANNTEITGTAPPPVAAQVRAPASSPAPTASASPTAAPSQLTATRAPAAAAPAEAAAPASEAGGPAKLPKTGSMLPLAGLLGLLFMGAGFGLRLARRA